MVRILKKLIIMFSLLTMSNAYANCVYTSVTRNGVYAYAFTKVVGAVGSETYSLWLGKFIGTMQGANGTIVYNGQTYGVGAYRDKGCLGGKNCSNERYEYEVCTVTPAVAFSYTTTQDQAAGCPATRPSGYILQRRTYEVWTDGSARNFGAWYNVADYCSAVYSYTGYNYTTSACPATQPSGVINMAQSYQVFSDGSVQNYSAWYVTSNTCAAVYQTTESRSQTVACPSTYPNGAGLKQTGTRQIWSDGPRAWSAWTTVEFACSKTVSDVKDNSRKTCGEGQTGYRVTEWRRTHVEYISQSNLTPAQLAIENEKNATAWTEVEVANTCTNVPDKVTTEPGTRLLTCASVYGGQTSDYTGEVTETGTKVYTYSSVSKQTTTTFKSNIPPTYNSTCKSTVSDVTTETSTKACPSGYTGTITSYRYVATDSKGVKTYPNGADFIESNNTCVSTGASLDDSGLISSTVKSKGLLANNTIKTSSLNTNTDLETFIKTLDKSTIDYSNTYKLHLIVDDLSTGKYNKANVTKTVAAFKSVTGQDPIITVPQSLDKYIGNGGITASNYKNKVFKSAIVNSNNQIIVKYSELTTGIKEGATSTFTINLF